MFAAMLAVEIGRRALVSALVLHAVGPTAAGITIAERPIAFPQERIELTVDYRRLHQSASEDSIEIVPRIVVLHYTAGRSLEGAFRTFNRVRLPASRSRIRAGGDVNVSAHYLVDLDGSIHRLMPEVWMGRHVIGLNHVAIGIENVGGVPGVPLTRAQAVANAKLIRYLSWRFPLTHVIGHYQYRDMETHPYWLERDPNYRTGKSDPGEAFMAEVRTLIADLELHGAPDPEPETGARGRE